MPEKFNLIPNRTDPKASTGFQGYQAKADLTVLPPGYLVSPSRNVLTNDADRVGIRRGYTLDGAASVTEAPVLSSYEWTTCRGEERPIRFANGTIEFRYIDGTWYTLGTGYGSNVLNFAEYWNTTEKEDSLLFVNGTANIFDWNGAIATFASATATTLTLEGSRTWAELGFRTTSSKSLRINGVDYTYTGGESTTTLTGLSADLSATAVGTLIVQNIKTHAVSTMTLPATFAATQTLDLISVLNNEVWVASLISRYVWKSKQNDLTTYTSASPRIPGDGDTLTLDGAVNAFAPQTNESDSNGSLMLISAGNDFWYRVTYTLSADLANESAQVKKLSAAAKQAARSQACVAQIKNSTVYLSNEPTIDTLGRVENIDTPQSRPISDPIKFDLDGYDLSNAHLKYHKNMVWMALPAESLVLVYNLQKQYWEAPQTLPVQRFAIIGGELYGHSNAVPETYKLFDGFNDNGNPIEAIAAFSYENFGRRDAKKSEDANYSEGYISSNTVLTCALKYDFGGSTSIIEKEIDGNDDPIIFSTTADGSLGKNPYGSMPPGSVTDSQTGNPKFRIIHALGREGLSYYERQVVYQTNDVDQQWEILAYGSNATLSPDNQSEITQ